MMLTLASEEVSNSQLAKDYLIVILNFITDELLLAVDERFRGIFGFRVVKGFVD